MPEISVIDAARHLVATGFFPIPLQRSGDNWKRPILGRGWQRQRLGEDDLDRHFGGDPVNVGVLLGEPVGGFVDIDLDSPDAIRLADDYLPPTTCEWGRASKPRSHRLYKVSGPARPLRQVRHESETLLEWRAQSADGLPTQTRAPGSVTEDGERVEFTRERAGRPTEVDGEALWLAFESLASAVLRCRGVPDAGWVENGSGTVEHGPIAFGSGTPHDPDDDTWVDPFVPSRFGQRDALFWDMIRMGKCSLGLSREVARRHVLGRWYRLSKPSIRRSFDGVRSDFESQWRRAVTSPDELHAIPDAARLASACPAPSSVADAFADRPHVQRLYVGLTHFDRCSGGRPFPCSSRTAVRIMFGAFLDESEVESRSRQGSRCLRYLADAGFIECTHEGRKGFGGERDSAAKWRLVRRESDASTPSVTSPPRIGAA